MAQDSKIEWTKHTCNLWIGCTHVHAGCDNCYAEALAKRWGNDLWGNDKPRKAVKSVWDDFKKYQKQAAAKGEIDSVFVGSLMDIGEKPMGVIDSKGVEMRNPDGFLMSTGHIRARYCEEVVPNTPNLLHLMLSKRPGNYLYYMPEAWKVNPPTNVMFGTSIVNPATAKTLLPQLKKVNGYRFLSLEPQLENITDIDLSGIDWVIQGGESGHHKRPFNTDWARTMRDECLRQGVPYFFKQIDKVQPIPDDLQIRQFPVLGAVLAQ